MPGITGRLYSQFAVTISVSVVISSINALTLSPALCGLILKARSGPPRGIMGLFDRGITSVRDGYTAIIRRLVRVAFVGVAVVVGAIALIVTLGGSLPQGFLPSEDQGYLMVDVQLPDGAALERTESVTERVIELARSTAGVENVVIVNGYSILNGATSSNAALIIATMSGWDERQEPGLKIDAILGKFWAQFSTIPGANIIAFNPPPIPGLGTTGGVQAMLQQTGWRHAAGSRVGRRFNGLFGQPEPGYRAGLFHVPGQCTAGFCGPRPAEGQKRWGSVSRMSSPRSRPIWDPIISTTSTSSAGFTRS